MKKITIRFLLFISALLVIAIIARITGIIQFYSIPGTSMDPTLKQGSHVFVTNLKKAKRNSIIVFKRVLTDKHDIELMGNKAIFNYRLIASGGETVQIKDGYAFVNGQMIDDSTKLRFFYRMSHDAGMKVADKFGLMGKNDLSYSTMSDDFSILSLTYQQYKDALQIGTVELYNPEFDGSMLYQNDSTKTWTVNNYGPLTIPEGYCFVLGDNRNQAQDSRYIGLIPKKDIIGTALHK